MERLKRVAAINDISGLGKCSLTVALPIISAAGVECAVIPTALLSTHTGVFTGWTFKDLSDQILPIAEHWHDTKAVFDGIYTGYLANPEQGRMISEVIDLLRNEDTLVITDPAMADNGRYYSNQDQRMAECFRNMFSKADVITPNLTEACFLADRPYQDGVVNLNQINKILDDLLSMGPRSAVVTSVSLEKGKIGIVSRSKTDKEPQIYMADTRNGMFHGSGDVFTSALAALLVRGFDLQTALRISMGFTADSILRTERRGSPTHYGLDFESALPNFILEIEKSVEKASTQ